MPPSVLQRCPVPIHSAYQCPDLYPPPTDPPCQRRSTRSPRGGCSARRTTPGARLRARSKPWRDVRPEYDQSYFLGSGNSCLNRTVTNPVCPSFFVFDNDC
ncbi:unnamed protein product [Chondrus crispus]|uniref:Uncharacterized protein n=1 Tax=Chondrus crispus TaxID=2769 RepID=R7QIA0_CHOCR|nr:unnamed protein product [Chondrus crispus]CDF37201.1 unnamed protein product [Chondrus crispus]|eukprot:XP_005717020.1 unnamed protein product [Chondrus crispus]